jgi:hypothetical protein
MLEQPQRMIDDNFKCETFPSVGQSEYEVTDYLVQDKCGVEHMIQYCKHVVQNKASVERFPPIGECTLP